MFCQKQTHKNFLIRRQSMPSTWSRHFLFRSSSPHPEAAKASLKSSSRSRASPCPPDAQKRGRFCISPSSSLKISLFSLFPFLLLYSLPFSLSLLPSLPPGKRGKFFVTLLLFGTKNFPLFPSLLSEQKIFLFSRFFNLIPAFPYKADSKFPFP